MTSRERVLNAINHEVPDRIPIDLGATRQSGIAASAYHQLKSILGIRTPTRVVDLIQFLAEVEQPVLERFGVDVVGVFRPQTNPGFAIRGENWKPWRLFDGTPVEVPGAFDPVLESDGGYAMVRDGIVIARMPKEGWIYEGNVTRRVGRDVGFQGIHGGPVSHYAPVTRGRPCPLE